MTLIYKFPYAKPFVKIGESVAWSVPIEIQRQFLKDAEEVYVCLDKTTIAPKPFISGKKPAEEQYMVFKRKVIRLGAEDRQCVYITICNTALGYLGINKKKLSDTQINAIVKQHEKLGLTISLEKEV